MASLDCEVGDFVAVDSSLAVDVTVFTGEIVSSAGAKLPALKAAWSAETVDSVYITDIEFEWVLNGSASSTSETPDAPAPADGAEHHTASQGKAALGWATTTNIAPATDYVIRYRAVGAGDADGPWSDWIALRTPNNMVSTDTDKVAGTKSTDVLAQIAAALAAAAANIVAVQGLQTQVDAGLADARAQIAAAQVAATADVASVRAEVFGPTGVQATLSSAILQVQVAQASAATDLSTTKATLQAATAAAQADATSALSGVTGANSAAAAAQAAASSALSGLTATNAAVTTAQGDARSALAQAATNAQTLVSFTSTFNSYTADAAIKFAALTTADSALSGRIDSLTSTVGGVSAAVTAESVARVNAVSALADQISTVSATFNPSPNLIPDANMVQQLLHYSLSGNAGAPVWQWGSDDKGNYAYFIGDVSAGVSIIQTETFPLRAGSPTTVSVEAASVGPATGQLVMNLETFGNVPNGYAADFNAPAFFSSYKVITANALGARSSITHIPSEDHGHVQWGSLRVYVQGGAWNAGSAYAIVRRWKAEAGSTATAFSDDATPTLTYAAITTEQTARATADNALASTITTLTANVNGNTAAISNEATVRSTADTALSGRIDTVTATTGANAAAITAESLARADAISALALTVASVSASQNTGANLLQDPTFTQGARYWDQDKDVGTPSWQFNSDDLGGYAVLSGDLGPGKVSILIAKAVRTTGGRPVTLSQESARSGGAGGNLVADLVDYPNLASGYGPDYAHATFGCLGYPVLTTLAVGTRKAFTYTPPGSGPRWAVVRYFVSEGTGWTALVRRPKLEFGSIATGFSDDTGAPLVASDVSVETIARTTADTSLASQITTLTATVGGNTAAINSNYTALANADSALGSRIDALTATVGSNTSAISAESLARANAVSSLAQTISQVSAASNTGANLLADPTFGQGARYWHTDVSSGAVPSWQFNNDDYGRYVSFLGDTGGGGAFSIIRSDPIRTSGGRALTLSQESARSGGVGGALYVDVVDYPNIAGGYAPDYSQGTAGMLGYPQLTDGAIGTRRGFSYTPPGSGIRWAVVRYYVQNGSGWGAVIRRPKLELGSVATGFSDDTAAPLSAADVSTETIARTTGDTALASQITTLTATVGGNAATIGSNYTALANADSALGSRIDTLTASTAANAAAISTEGTARANADGALSYRIDRVTALANTGANLLNDPTFSQGLKYWTTVTSPGVPAWFSGSDDNGGYVVFDGSAQSTDGVNYSSINSQVFRMSGSTPITVSMEAQNPPGSGGVLVVDLVDQPNVAGGYAPDYAHSTYGCLGYPTITDTSLGTRRSWTFTPPGNGIRWGFIRVFAQGGANWHAAAMRRPKVELGSVATAFTDEATSVLIAASVSTETLARTTADSAFASQVTSITATVGSNAAAITSNYSTLATADQALGSRIDSLTTTVGGNSTTISNNYSALTNADGALGSRIDGLVTVAGNNGAAITSEAAARAGADSALGGRIDSLTATVGANAAAITAESLARANADGATASQIGTLSSRFNSGPNLVNDANMSSGFTHFALSQSGGVAPWIWGADEHGIYALYLADTGGGLAIIQTEWFRITAGAPITCSVDASTNGNTSGALLMNLGVCANVAGGYSPDYSTVFFDTGYTAITATALGQVRTSSTYTPAASRGAVQWGSLRVFVAGGNWTGAAATLRRWKVEPGTVATVWTDEATVASSAAAITNEQTTRANADSAFSSSVSTLTATVNGNTATISSNYTALVNADGAISSRVDSTTATSNGNAAAINSESIARTNADGALGSRIDTVTSTANGLSATVQTNISTLATITGQLYGSYGVRINANGNAAGFTIYSSSGPIQTSGFLIEADQFVLRKAGSSFIPFLFDTGTGTAYLQNVAISGSLVVAGTVTTNTVAAGSLSAKAFQTAYPNMTVTTGSQDISGSTATIYIYDSNTQVAIDAWCEVANTLSTGATIVVQIWRDGPGGQVLIDSAALSLIQNSGNLFHLPTLDQQSKTSSNYNYFLRAYATDYSGVSITRAKVRVQADYR